MASDLFGGARRFFHSAQGGPEQISGDGFRRFTLHSWPYTSLSRAENPQRLLERLASDPKLRGDLLELYDGRLPTLSELRHDTALLNKAASRPLTAGIELHRSLSRISFMKHYDDSDPRSLVCIFSRHPSNAAYGSDDPVAIRINASSSSRPAPATT
jgi:hypothetical protein